MLLKNNTGGYSRVGFTVVQDPKDPTAFIYSSPDDTNIIGIVTKSVPKYSKCEIANSGTAKVFVFERTVKSSIIRAAKSGDNISRGTCKTKANTDASYFKVGTALETGKGLINCALSLSYNGSSGAIANGTYTVGLGNVTDGTITIENGIITAIQEAT